MHRIARTALSLIAALLITPLLTGQTVPGTINYQGRLSDNSPSQVPFTGTANMKFVLWNLATAGAVQWTEPASGTTAIAVTGGIFSVRLGANGVPIPASVFSASPVRYLEITVNGEILTPRQALTSTGYADQAENASTASTAVNSTQLGGLTSAAWQQRVSGTCTASQAMNVVNANGTVGCVSVPAGASFSGTANYVVKFTGASTGGNSLIYDNGVDVGLGTTIPIYPFDVLSAAATTAGSFENSNAAADGLEATNTATAGSGQGAGVVGFTSQSGSSAAGVWGQNNHPAGTGVVGTNGAANGNGSGRGVFGSSGQLAGAGVSGQSFHASGTGVLGGGNNLTPLALASGSGGAFTGYTTGLYAKSTSAGSSESLYTDNFGNIVSVNYYDGFTQYKITGGGSVATNVADPTDASAARRITLYAAESPEIIFTDFGQGMLQDGRAHVELDPRFAANVTINGNHPLRVFIQLEDDDTSPGVVVKNKTATGFDVVERQGGHSHAPFQWQIICNRADEPLAGGRVSHNADMRFAPVVPGPAQAPAATAVPVARPAPPQR